MTPMLAGCATSGAVSARLAPLPADLALCFRHAVPQPAEPPKSRRAVAALIAALKASEGAMQGCGRRLVVFYEAQDAALAGAAR